METYILTNGIAVKIGKSRDSKRRLVSLQTSSPYKLKMVAIFEEDIEKTLHIRFKDHRMSGEWFSMEILSLYNWICSQIGRDDIIGDFARDTLGMDCIVTEKFPVFETNYWKLKEYLVYRGACREARFAMARCYRAWQRVNRGLDANIDRGNRFKSDGSYTGSWIYG